MRRERAFVILSSCALVLGAVPASADVIDVVITVENLAPQNGTFQTPFWVGLHDGGFDLYDIGAAATPGLERLAEDGTTSFLSGEFQASGNGTLDGVIAPGGPFAPGDVASITLTIDTDDPTHRWLSWASMVIPSNDAFVGNGDPLAHQIFDGSGNFLGVDFFVTGADVRDAGTEVNTEIPEHTAFFGQTMPDTGIDENGTVQMHPGYLGSFGNPGDPQSILADPMFAGADFSLPGYPIARITVQEVPAPGALTLMGLAALGTRRRRRALA